MKWMNMMMFLTALAAGMTVAACKSGGDMETARGDAISVLYSPVELKEDFARFRRIMERKTIGLYTDRTAQGALLNDIEASLDRPMTELEFYRLLAPVVAHLRCGHSFLSVSEEMQAYMRREAKFFPLEVRIFDGRLFVIGDPHAVGVEPGTEVLSINGRPADKVVHRITSLLSTDGRDTGRPRYDAERWFAAMYYSYIETAESFRLGVIPPGRTVPAEVDIPAVRDTSLAKTAKGVMHDTANTPWESAVTDKYALLRVPTFNLNNPKEFAEFLKRFFSDLDSRGTEELVLDLRGNYGGTPVPTVELFRYLIDRPLPFFAQDNPIYLNRWKKPVDPAPEAFDGELVVLMDEAGFSMNSFLLSLLKYHDIGTLVGTQSSGGYMCSDASIDKVLKNTGLRLRYSTRVFKTAVEGQEAGIGIAPDIPVQWTLEDCLSDADPVLDMALEMIRQ